MSKLQEMRNNEVTQTRIYTLYKYIYSIDINLIVLIIYNIIRTKF